MLLAEKLSYFGVVLPSLALLSPRRMISNPQRRFACANGLQVQWHDTWPRDQRIIEGWDQFLDHHRMCSPFQSPAWQRALARPFVRAGRFRMLTVWQHLDLLGVLPLQVGPGGRMQTLGSMISDYLEPIVDPQMSDRIWNAMFQSLARAPGGAPAELIMDNLRPEAMNFHALRAAAEENAFDVTIEPSVTVTRVPLAESWDMYLSALGGHDRKEIRRKLRKATEQAGATLVTVSSQPDVLGAVEKVFDFMRQSGGAKSIKARWTYRPMFRRIAQPLARAGRLCVHMLRLEGRDAAGVICFPGPTGPLAWAAAFDGEMSRWSPGIVLFAMTIQRAIDAGATCFDLLRGQQRYKSELGAVDVPIYRAVIKRR